MLIRRAFTLLLIFAFGGVCAAAETKFDSKIIYGYCQSLAASENGRIWPGFEPLKYTKLKTAEGKNFLQFTSDNSFSWSLSDEYFANHTLEENLSITFHEAFHAFQRDDSREGLKWGAENSLLIFEYKESSTRNNALFGIEARILYDALQTADEKDLREKVRQFLAIRRLRQSELEPRFAEFEKGSESNEGLADYAGAKAVTLAIEDAGQNNIPFNFTDGNEYLLKKYVSLKAINKIGKNPRLKFYYTGSAQALLLDRLLPGWKRGVQMGGNSVQDLLGSAVKQPPTEKTIVKTLQRYGYAAALKEEELRAEKRKLEKMALLKSVLDRQGREYVIDFSGLRHPGQIRSFDPMNVTMINPKLRIHTRSVSFAGKDTFTASFSQPVVEDLDNRQYKTIVSADESITADDRTLRLPPAGEISFNKSLIIETSGFKLKAAAAGIIRSDRRKIVIILSDKK